jgi:hypothetical protein
MPLISDPLLNSLGPGRCLLVARRRLSILAVFRSLFLLLLAFPLSGTLSSSPLPVGIRTARRT